MKYARERGGFWQTPADKTGVLSAVLEEFGKYDPLVVMQSFDNRLLNAAGLIAGLFSMLANTNSFTSGLLGSAS